MVQEKTHFDDFLRTVPDLGGRGDLVNLLPGLFYMWITNGGTVSYGSNVLAYYPKNANHDTATGIEYVRHLVTFREAVDSLGIETLSEPFRKAPVQCPNRNKLRELLENPNSIQGRKVTNKFAHGILLGGQELRILVNPLDGDESYTGKVSPYWFSYLKNVGRPLTKVLWQF